MVKEVAGNDIHSCCCPIKLFYAQKLRLSPISELVLIVYFVVAKNNIVNHGKSSHFIGQPMCSQEIKLLGESRILQISREKGGERYTKRFNVWFIWS